MRRSLYTSKYSAVVLSFLLTVSFGSASQSAHNLRDPVDGIPPAGAEKEPHETGGGLLSPVRSTGAAPPKAERVDAGDRVSWHSNDFQFRPHEAVKLPHEIPLPHSGYMEKQKDAAGRESEPQHDVRAGSQVKPQELGRQKRSTDSSMKDNNGDNGDHPLSDEPGAKVHCWNEEHVFDVVLPASEVAKHFPHECQDPLSCNTTCVAKVPRNDLCARLKSGCTEPTQHAVPETQPGTAQNENMQLALFEKNVERRLGELEAKLAQLSLESSYNKDKLSEVGHNLNHFGNAFKEQFQAASVKTLDSLDRKAAQMEALFNERSESMMTSISSVMSLIQSDSKMHLWTLKGYAEKKAKAIKNGYSSGMSDNVYIRRYLISWGIDFVKNKNTGGVAVHLSLKLRKGISDEFLEWPFSNELKLSIIHPETGEKQEARGKPFKGASDKKYYARPVEATNPGVYFPSIKFETSYLERNGYVKTDQLLVKLEML